MMAKHQGSDPQRLAPSLLPVVVAEAKAMMQALRNQAIPDPGGILRLKDTDFVPQTLRGVYIRDCYKELAKVVLTTLQTLFICE